jgi:hypothetical protein
MCSMPGGGPATLRAASGASRPVELGQPDGLCQPGELDRLGRAIDELAAAAQARDATVQDVAARLARVWEMVADLDPELARRLAGYDI